MATYDTIIIGAGGMGSAVAYHAARRGQRVLAIDRFTPAHDKGSSHGRSRVIRKAYFEDPRYVPMLHRAYELWHELDRNTNEKLLHFCGVLNMGPAEHECIRGVLDCAREHGLPHELLDATEIERRWPTFKPAPDDVGVFEADGGFHLPERAIQLHLQLAETNGAEFRWSTEVRSWKATPDEVRIATSDGEHVAKNLVITAGAWLPTLANALALPIKIERQVQLWWKPKDAALCRHDRMPAFIHFTADRAYYGIPSTADEGPKIARHHGGDITTADALDRSLRTEDESDVRAYIRNHVPNADGPLLAHAVCMYTNTPDDHFILDRHPQHENVIIAGGFSGHGFKFAPLVGEITADLLDANAEREPIGLFEIKRLMRGPR
ncbi:MAG: N-methyl-L-tryptophan oxidase [Phycisphaerales bacterium]|nr:N-methyl-L-tryptophan oxidase [Phycisphaerales bacterium]MCB9863429.1 N-methyl-L-tryptophan oxidase [Phycisphaerales bacterium]